jgi:hypothetical protein
MPLDPKEAEEFDATFPLKENLLNTENHNCVLKF